MTLPVTLPAAIWSDLDSRRFGYRIGRLSLDDASSSSPDPAALAAACDGFDIVILRAPTSAAALPGAMASLDGWRTLPADHLCYWEWAGPAGSQPPVPPEPAPGTRWVDTHDPALVEPLVRSAFVGYPHHYAVNPLLDPDGALEGYVEWTHALVSSPRSTTKVGLDASGGVAAFAVIDWTVNDIRLGGVHPDAQGGGWYRHMIAVLQYEAAVRAPGSLPLLISSQSHNIGVMRTWARLGFVPYKSVATYHLVTEAAWSARPTRPELAPAG